MVRNTFIQGTTLDVSQFDNQKFSNQKTTDGTKDIFDSGYTYSPILYFPTCSANSKIYFQFNGSSNSYLSLASTSGTGSRTISGFSTNNYPLSASEVYNIFDSVNLGGSYLKPGTLSQYPTYSVQEGGSHKVSGSLTMTINMPEGGTSTWSLGVYKNTSGTPLISDQQSISVLNEATASYTHTTLYSYQSALYPTTVTSNKPIYLFGTSYPSGTSFIKWNAYFLTGSGYPTCDFGGGSGNWYSLYNYGGVMTTPQDCGFTSVTTRFEFDWNMYRIDDFETPAGSQTTTFSLNSSNISVDKNDKLNIRFKKESSSTNNFTASFDNIGSLFISSLSVSTGYADTECPYFNSASMAISSSITGSDSVIIFDDALSSFYGGGYTFSPNPLTGSINTLYSTYGDVDYPFLIKPQDILIVYLSDGTYIESRILQVSSLNNLIQIQLDTQLSNLYRSDLSSGSYQRFLLLTRIEDETNAYLTFPKRAGQTSYGLVIPSNIHPDVLANIDAITENVKRRLIESGEVVA